MTGPLSPLPTPSQAPKTPLINEAIRHAHRDFKKSPSKFKVSMAFAVTHTLSSQVSVLEHEVRGLRMAIILNNEKRKKERD